MIVSMTGFGSSIRAIEGVGKVCVELRSTNHKFLETTFRLPEELLHLEDKIKQEIESKVRRGRTSCAISFLEKKASAASLNKDVLKQYHAILTSAAKELGIKEGVSINALIHLPGVVSQGEKCFPRMHVWPKLKPLVKTALDDLLKMRRKEGLALSGILQQMAEALQTDLKFIKTRYKAAIKEKLVHVATDEERASFLKDSDITEETDRLWFHIRSLRSKLSASGPIGKELDFMAQEMQREANTIGAKTFDVAISGKVVQIKSQIEKIREQVQNIE